LIYTSVVVWIWSVPPKGSWVKVWLPADGLLGRDWSWVGDRIYL
jgi:hypothetical protein